MRILTVNHLLDPITGGGTAERTFQLSRALAKAGAGCRVLTTDVGLTRERREMMSMVDLMALPCLASRWFLPAGGLRRIRAAVQDCDLVHLMGHWTALNALAYSFARRLGKPYVICPAGALPLFGRSQLKKRAYNAVVGGRIVRNASGWIAVTPGELPAFESYGIDPERVEVIPNGICPDEFPAGDSSAFRRAHRLGDGPLLLFMGRLAPIKGPDLLLEAFECVIDQLPGATLVFVGPDGGMERALRRRVEDHRLEDRVRFLGYLGGAAKAEAYAAADLLVIPSRQEAMSIVVLEAGCTGTPVLITDQCGFNRVEQIGGGRVVPASAEGLGEGLLQLLARPAELPEMGARLRRYVVAEYDWSRIVERHCQLFERCLARPAVLPKAA